MRNWVLFSQSHDAHWVAITAVLSMVAVPNFNHICLISSVIVVVIEWLTVQSTLSTLSLFWQKFEIKNANGRHRSVGVWWLWLVHLFTSLKFLRTVCARHSLPFRCPLSRRGELLENYQLSNPVSHAIFLHHEWLNESIQDSQQATEWYEVYWHELSLERPCKPKVCCQPGIMRQRAISWTYLAFINTSPQILWNDTSWSCPSWPTEPSHQIVTWELVPSSIEWKLSESGAFVYP